MDLVAVNHWPVAIETHSRNHPEARHYCMDLEAAKPEELVPDGRLDLLMASPTCFPAGTTVLTDRGPVPIERISIGDRVLTHAGRWRPVINTMSRRAGTVLVKGQGHFGFVTTPEHRFLACTNDYRERAESHAVTPPRWTPADRLTGHFWCTPTTFPSLPVPAVEWRSAPDDQGFWWIVGRWLGDGFVGLKPKNIEVIIACGHHEVDALAARLSVHEPSAGRPHASDGEIRWHVRRQATASRFVTGHKYLAFWLVENFGRLAHEKTMPAWALGMPEENRRALLDGYISADGHTNNRNTICETASRKLAVGIRLLAESLGHRCSLHFKAARKNATIEGRSVRERPHYLVKWVNDPKRSWHRVTDGRAWSRVDSVAVTDAEAEVFDITVAEDHSFVADGIIVHNCTFHSRARGGKPINDQQRMDPWHVVRWCTTLRVKRLIVENVPEFVDWGPCDLRTGRPMKRRRGEYFRAWVAALEGCGFRLQWRVLNAADFGDATTRERFFLLGRSDGRRIRWPDPTHSRDGIDLLGQAVQKWRPARDIIDWAIEGRSIFERKRPLSPKTLARIHAGAVKFRWPEPFLVILRQHMNAQSIDEPVPTLCASGNHVYLAQPFTLSNSSNGAPRTIDEPLPTITTGGASNVLRPGCARPAIVEPFISPMRTGNAAAEIDAPVPALTAKSQIAVVEPFILNRHGDNGSVRAHPIDDPVPTADCRGAGYVVEPFIATLAHGNEAHERNPDARRCRSIEQPLQTIHAGGGKFGIVEPFVLSQASGGSPRSVDDPIPTITTGGAGGAHALIAPYYGSGSGETCGTVDNPLPTVTAKPRFGLVVPVTNSNGGPTPRSIDDPIPTMTTAKGGEFAMVMPVTHGDDKGRFRSADEPLPTVTGAHRGELAFIAAAFGERPGQAARVHDIDEPTPTICATGRVQLVEPVAEGRRFDIRFRMLEPHELARAMGFHDDETAYKFCGNKTQITRQIGNAVPVATAAALVRAIMEPR